MNVLIIAPSVNPTLEFVQPEMDAVARLLHAQTLTGIVTVNRLMQQIENQRLDILWFATHGIRDGIFLDDGLLTREMLGQITSSCSARLLVLNSCESAEVGLRIHYDLGIDVICTITKADDRSAFVMAVTFAKRISIGYSFKEAYNHLATDNYKFFSENGDVMNDDGLGRISGLSRIEARLLAIENALSSIATRISVIETKMEFIQNSKTQIPNLFLAIGLILSVSVLFWLIIYTVNIRS